VNSKQLNFGSLAGQEHSHRCIVELKMKVKSIQTITQHKQIAFYKPADRAAKAWRLRKPQASAGKKEIMYGASTSVR
jgi:hypothetical protein